jgi:hypothetical protein
MGRRKVIIHYAMEEDTMCGEFTGTLDENEPAVVHTTIKENVTCKECLEELKSIKNKKKVTDWSFTGK